jgi:hypothetical protein
MAILLVPGGSYDLDLETARQAPLELRLAVLDEPTCQLTARIPAPGEKGILHDLLVEIGPLAGPAGILALTRIVSVWLSRDRRRILTIKSTRIGNSTAVTVSGENIALSTIEAAIRHALDSDAAPGQHLPRGGANAAAANGDGINGEDDQPTAADA